MIHMNLPVLCLSEISFLLTTHSLSHTEKFCSVDFSFSLSRLSLRPCLSPGGTGLCGLGAPVCASLKVPPSSHLLRLWSLLSPS